MLDLIKGGLIVSCQAKEDEPAFGAELVGKIALSAKEGGAKAICAEGITAIKEIKRLIDLPVIGFIKKNYDNSDVCITPTLDEVEALINTPCEMIALDMTMRARPNREKLLFLVRCIKDSGKLILGAVSTFEEGIMAEEFGADAVTTMLYGRTPYSSATDEGNYKFIEALSKELNVPVIAEGRINKPEELKEVIEKGAYAGTVSSSVIEAEGIDSFVKEL